MTKEEKEKIRELVNRRRHQILVHSCIYYYYDLNIIDDNTFDRWCNELLDLQAKYPEICKKVRWHKPFTEKFSHASGFNLPYSHKRIRSRAESILRARGML